MSTSYPISPPSSTDKNVGEVFAPVPLRIMARTDLSQTSKLLYGLIVGLARQRGHCFASDAYLGNALGVSERQATRAVQELERERLILITGATKNRHLKPWSTTDGITDIFVGNQGEKSGSLTTKTAEIPAPLPTKTSAITDKNVGRIESEKIREKISLTPAALSDRKERCRALLPAPLRAALEARENPPPSPKSSQRPDPPKIEA